MRTTSMQMSFPETVFDSLCRNSLVIQTDCCSSCPGGWSQTILEVKMLDVEVLGWCGYTWYAVVRLNSRETALVDIPAVNMPIARSLEICDICGIVRCDKTAHFRVAFFVASLRHTCAIIMLSNQHLDMPHLWGGWIISARRNAH